MKKTIALFTLLLSYVTAGAHRRVCTSSIERRS